MPHGRHAAKASTPLHSGEGMTRVFAGFIATATAQRRRTIASATARESTSYSWSLTCCLSWRTAVRGCSVMGAHPMHRKPDRCTRSGLDPNCGFTREGLSGVPRATRLSLVALTSSVVSLRGEQLDLRSTRDAAGDQEHLGNTYNPALGVGNRARRAAPAGDPRPKRLAQTARHNDAPLGPQAACQLDGRSGECRGDRACGTGTGRRLRATGHEACLRPLLGAGGRAGPPSPVIATPPSDPVRARAGGRVRPARRELPCVGGVLRRAPLTLADPKANGRKQADR